MRKSPIAAAALFLERARSVRAAGPPTRDRPNPMPPPSSSPAPQLQTTCPYLHRLITNTSCRPHGWPGQHSTTQSIGRNNGPPISVTEFRFTKGHSYDVHRGHSHDVHICRSADRPTTALPCAASGCYGCALCWRGLTGVPRLTRTSGIATGTSRERLASRDTSKDAKGLAILHLFR